MSRPKLRFPEFSDKWQERRLEDLFTEFKSGQGITSTDISEEGNFRVFGGNGLRGYSDKYTHEGEYFLIGRQGALCGNINRVKGKVFISEHAIACKANETSNTEWLAQRLDYSNLNRLSESSAQPGLSVNKLLRLKLSTPCLPEQSKIANFLSSMDDKQSLLKKKKSLLEQYKKGVMQKLFDVKTDCNPPLRFKCKNGNDFPDWEMKVLGELTDRNICYGVVQPGKEDINGVKFIRGGDVFNGKISKNLRIISTEITDNYQRTCLKGGELIMSLVGYPGETAIVPPELKGANLARQVGLIDLKDSINSLFVHYYIVSEYGKKNLLGKTIGSAQKVINIVDLKKLIIPIPTLPEQQRIANFLSAIDDKINFCGVQIEKMECWKKGLLQRMFV